MMRRRDRHSVVRRTVAMWCAIGWLSGEKTAIGREALALSYMTSGTPPMGVSLYVDSSHACIVGKVLSYWKQCDTPPCRAKPGKMVCALAEGPRCGGFSSP